MCLAWFFSLIEIGELLEFEGCIHWVFQRIVIIPADRATHTPEPAVNDALTIFHTISVVFVRSQNVWICWTHFHCSRRKDTLTSWWLGCAGFWMKVMSRLVGHDLDFGQTFYIPLIDSFHLYHFVHWFIHRGNIWTHTWPAPSICGFLAALVKNEWFVYFNLSQSRLNYIAPASRGHGFKPTQLLKLRSWLWESWLYLISYPQFYIRLSCKLPNVMYGFSHDDL